MRHCTRVSRECKAYTRVKPAVSRSLIRLCCWVCARVVHHHWWSIFALVIVVSLIVVAGVLACGVGVLVAAPVASASLMYVYEDLFGAETKPPLAMSSPDA